MKSHFLIAAAGSGSGKTTLTLGILRALRNRGLAVAPFKCGPDYVDPALHTMASGAVAVNLDRFLSSENHLHDLYDKYGAGKDVSVTEGVMGLFDGYDRSAGSSAQVAAVLDIPVILVVDGRSTAYSVAPLLYGFSRFSDKIRVAGVIFNFVSSENHYNILRRACQDVGLEALGCLPKDPSLAIPSRYLGLMLDAGLAHETAIRSVAASVEKEIDLDRLLEITRPKHLASSFGQPASVGSLRIAVARDEAFSFIYAENLAALEELGEVVFFSPLADEKLPEADAVYFPGGYPELFLLRLSGNETMKQSIRDHVESGGKVWAEGGGMMYLSESITGADGRRFPMVGIFGQSASMEHPKLSLGYRRFEMNGRTWKGHEFHYSQIDSDLPVITQQFNVRGEPVSTKILRYKNALASYTHLYWGEHRNFMQIFD
jgi:cobyrinic acid a,c-diamide synthase